MILSAIGLPMPGQSIVNLPPPAPDRVEGVQAVGAAVAPGGAGRTRDPDTDAGSSAGRQSARDEARVIRLAAGASLRQAEAIAGPQPAFEIAVLEKLREDAMRVPPDAPDTPPAPPEKPRDLRARPSDAVETPEVPGDARVTAEDDPRALDRAAERPVDRPNERTGPERTAAERTAADRAPERIGDRSADRAESRERVREPADEGFDDARRMSEERSPPRIDVTR
jgi:hypothetical protein